MGSHGTVGRYRAGCRCEECKKAKKAAAADLFQRSKTGDVKPPGRPKIPLSEREHGNYVTYAKGCRCAECTRANCEKGRSYRVSRHDVAVIEELDRIDSSCHEDVLLELTNRLEVE